jgi:hypothetical protein
MTVEASSPFIRLSTAVPRVLTVGAVAATRVPALLVEKQNPHRMPGR